MPDSDDNPPVLFLGCLSLGGLDVDDEDLTGSEAEENFFAGEEPKTMERANEWEDRNEFAGLQVEQESESETEAEEEEEGQEWEGNEFMEDVSLQLAVWTFLQHMEDVRNLVRRTWKEYRRQPTLPNLLTASLVTQSAVLAMRKRDDLMSHVLYPARDNLFIQFLRTALGTDGDAKEVTCLARSAGLMLDTWTDLAFFVSTPMEMKNYRSASTDDVPALNTKTKRRLSPRQLRAEAKSFFNAHISTTCFGMCSPRTPRTVLSATTYLIRKTLLVFQWQLWNDIGHITRRKLVEPQLKLFELAQLIFCSSERWLNKYEKYPLSILLHQ